ncbi:MAG: biotin/lipoyl-containing protein, partial [Candidatus Cybelea sp.]
MERTLVDVTLPEMGESVTEGSIVEWRKHVGDFVAEGDPLVEVTTDKVDVEVPATASGVVTQIAAREGETVTIGGLLAQIDTSQGNGAAAGPVSAGNGAPAPAPRPQAVAPPRPGELLA